MTSNTAQEPKTIFDFEVTSIDGGEIDFDRFRGKKILVVNTASECGYTPQYAQLQELSEQLADEVVVVGFPANNFGAQEPGSNEDIYAFCKKNYGVKFPLAAKVSVKGPDIHPLFRWLTTTDNPDFFGDIQWNFEKFLIDENGHLEHRFRSAVDPLSDEVIHAIKE